MKPKNLLSQLSELEANLTNFSFEELSTEDATRLKKSFETFKTHLEKRIWGEKIPIETDTDEESKTEQLQKTQEMLIATVSHEIRTPLSGIIGFADLLKESALSDDQMDQVNAIQSASNSLMDIINELLEYSKLAAGLENFEMVQFNFFSIVKDVVYLCNTLMLGKDVKLEVDIDSAIPENLVGDPSKLSQILLNLLGNSIKFVEQGEILLRIKKIQLEKETVLMEFTVTDTGIGISKEDLKHIFGSFKQANQQTFSKYGGAGLGLNIVKQIVEKLNGDIHVESTVGEGTTFKFTLPYVIAESAGLSASEPGEISEEQVKGMRILVFEDNPLNQRLIERRLNSWGCKTYITENPIYGLNLLKSTPIDLVLMDLRMPIMSGFEVTQKIRSNTKKTIREIPIIALTADFTIDDRNECENNQINDFILKPFTPEELLSKLVKHGNRLNTNFKLNSSSLDNGGDKTSANSDFDLESVLEDCLGELELLEELIVLYKRNALEFIGNVKMNLQEGNSEGVAFASHKIKAGLKMMKTMELFSIVEQLNTTAKTTRDERHMQYLLDRFVQEYPKAERLIDEEFLRMNKNKNE
ncbi:ATP-binding protein [uncultured Eudoraea sp.]|uniref:ATP-binding response regulator n=1 Tax=uncultured Eudoraea sp. TaxID=1035614 RepID=UPI00263454E9|nr:ATP-binding protein [uncultured Eudoraea sp.]